MDEQPPAVFNPDVRLTLLAAAGALVAIGLAVAAGDGAGRLLFAIAAVVAGLYAAGDVIFRPRLVAGLDGIVVRSPFHRMRLRWDEVDAVRVDARQRHGVRSVALEIEAAEQLVVLSRRALGVDPETAVSTMVLARAPRRRDLDGPAES